MLLSKATYSTFRLYIFCQYVWSLGIEPTTFALLTQCSTTEPQEHQLFELAFWRHPFIAEDPLVSKWCNAKISENQFKR